MNDKQLIKGCLQHHHQSQKLLYDRYSGQMYGICLRYHQDIHMANEALQRGFIAVFENLRKYNASGNLGGWIRTIIVRKCIDLIKEQQSLKYEDIEQLENQTLELGDIDPSSMQLKYSEITELLEQLPLGYKTVFSMYAIDGLKHSEIAESLEISITTSRSQLFKARKMMLGLIKEKSKKSRMQNSQL